jgi:rfaE bifunctional protein nucleotidyltransferase chain/domain
MTKIISKKKFLSIKKKIKSNNKIIVMTNGCFDIIHPGHIDIFEKSKKLGDLLVVLVNSDRSIRMLKGKKRPILKQHERLKILNAIQVIDYIILFNTQTPEKIYKELMPDILTKGSQYKKDAIAGSAYIQKKGGKIFLIPMLGSYSTTKIIKKIKSL